MIETIVYVVIALALLAATLWLVRTPQAVAPAAFLRKSQKVEELVPLHWRHLPQVVKALSGEDSEYVQRRVGKEEWRRWRAERSGVAREYLEALRGDFEHLTRLARIVAALSPSVDSRREAELFWLGMNFRILYTLAAVRISLGWGIARPLETLANFIAHMASGVESGITNLAEASLLKIEAELRA